MTKQASANSRTAAPKVSFLGCKFDFFLCRLLAEKCYNKDSAIFMRDKNEDNAIFMRCKERKAHAEYSKKLEKFSIKLALLAIKFRNAENFARSSECFLLSAKYAADKSKSVCFFFNARLDMNNKPGGITNADVEKFEKCIKCLGSSDKNKLDAMISQCEKLHDQVQIS